MISCACETIFGLNLLSLFQLQFRSALDSLFVVFVPGVTGGFYALEAMQLLPRYVEPLSARPTFLSRYLAWLLTVPVLLMQSGPLCGLPSASFFWVAVLTDAYIVCAFGALLAPTVAQKWSWIFVCLSTVALSMYATASVLRQASDKRTWYVWFLQGLFLVYGMFYLSAATSTISTFNEIVIFGILDIASKGIFSSCMFQKRLEDIYKAGWLIGRYLTATPSRGVEQEKRRIVGQFPDSQEWRPSEHLGGQGTAKYDDAPGPFAIVSPDSGRISAAESV
jgi:hypothetical protein